MGDVPVTTLAGIREEQDKDQADAAVQRMRADPTAGVSAILADTFTAWAPSAGLDGAGDMARALIAFVLTMTPGATHGDVPHLLEAMRVMAAARATAPEL